MTPTEFIRAHTPFRLWIGTLTEWREHTKSYLLPSTHNHHFRGQIEDKFLMFHEENTTVAWICILFVGRGLPFTANYRTGPETNWNSVYDRKDFDSGWTYWFTTGNKKPTQDEAINGLFRFLDQYNVNDFTQLLIKFRDEYEMDLNKLDLEKEELYLHYHAKLEMAIKEFLLGEFWAGSVSMVGHVSHSKPGRSTDELIRSYQELVEY